LCGAAVGDVAQVAFEHGRIEPQHAARHGVLSVAIFKFHGLHEQRLDFSFELSRPEAWIFKLELVDQINTEVAVHGLVAQNVLVLLSCARHFILPTQCQNLREPDVEEQAFHQAGKHNQRLEQCLIGFVRTGFKVRVGDDFNERNQELVFVPDGLHFVIGIENLSFVQTQRLGNVLIGMGVNGFFKCLTQQKLAALRRRDVAVRAQHNVVGG